MDLNFYADIGSKMNHCVMAHEAIEYEFEDFNQNYMQFVISDRVPNCMLSAMEH